LRRTLIACLLPAVAIAFSWLRIEEPARAAEAVAMVVLALAPAFVPRGWPRGVAIGAAAVGAAWVAFAAKTWELLPFRDERVLGPLGEDVGRGIADFYRVLLPIDPGPNPEMHALMLAAVFSFVLAVSLLVAARRPVGAAAATVVGAGWPATLVDGSSVVVGALALAAALSIPLVLRVRSGPSLAAGVAATALVVVGAAGASSATTIAREAALNWESWDLYGLPQRATAIRFAWDSNYEGIEFPPTETVVLTVEGPERATYWRTSTLDLFTDDHWFEDLTWLNRLASDGVRIPPDPLLPARGRDPESWLEQEIEVRALADDRLAAAGTPVALDSRRLGTVFRLTGGVLRVRDPLGHGQRYRVWSYAPDPAPAALARSRPQYPPEAVPHLEVASRVFPAFGVRGREVVVRQMLNDPSYSYFRPYQRLYAAARRVVGTPESPYAAVLALEAWFRYDGGFRYDEQPPKALGPPLVSFVTLTKAGYCQHYAGAMAVMLRMLGVPARVAVGFTSGTQDDDGKWQVTDHDAHAWVEAWFAGHGWVPFDPTPGRGTFGGSYSFASNSEAAVEALGRGDLSGQTALERDLPDTADLLPSDTASESRERSLFAVALGLGALWVAVVGFGKALLRRARYLTRDPRRAASASRRELEEYLSDQGIAVPPSATLDDVRRAVAEELGVDARTYAAAAARARFGRPGDAPQGAENARRELRALLRRARDELSLWARFRGFVSLRSLRRGWQA
jgi:transglutaminase-like putative cysteine protease